MKGANLDEAICVETVLKSCRLDKATLFKVWKFGRLALGALLLADTL
jgi:hypothetical protein